MAEKANIALDQNLVGPERSAANHTPSLVALDGTASSAETEAGSSTPKRTASPDDLQSPHESARATFTRPALLIASAIALIGLILFQLSTAPAFPAYRGFSALEWRSLKGFQHGTVPVMLELERGIYSLEGYSRADRAYAISKPFVLTAPNMELETVLAVLPEAAAKIRLKLKTEQNETIFDRALSELRHPIPLNGWVPTRIAVDPSQVGKTVSLYLVRESMPGMTSFVAVRDRMLLLESGSILSRTSSPPHRFWIGISASLLLAVLFVALARTTLLARLPMTALYVVFAVIAFGVHYRVTSFMFWDEIYLLEQFTRKDGFRGILYTHNEHFLPLFFGWFYWQQMVFKDWYLPYLLITTALHAANALLLVALLEKLAASGGPSLWRRSTSCLLGLLFLINSLHAETMQWAFEQCLLLQQLAGFMMFLAALEYIETNSRRALGLACVAAAIGPLLFANGFILPLQLGLVLMLDPRRVAGVVQWSREELPWRRIITVCGVVGLASLMPVALYLTHRTGVGNGLDKARPFEDLSRLWDYLFVGSEAGTVLRALGLFPYLATQDPETLFSPRLEPEIFLAWCGFTVTLALVLLAIKGPKAETEYSIRFILLGKLLILSSLFLPAFGRWQLGAIQSLSLRYHYGTLIGMAVMFYPLLSQMFRSLRSPRATARVGVGVLLGLHVFIQLFAGRNYSVSFFGPRHELYVEQLREWNTLLLSTADGGATTYEGTGTPYEGLQPLHVKSLTSERHPDEVYRALNWLDPIRFPWNEEKRTPRRTDL